MNIQLADIVESLNGRDAGKKFIVIGLEDCYAVIVDGKNRRIEKPKRKKLKHLKYICRQDSRVYNKIRSGEHLTNIEVRRALTEFDAGQFGDKGGM